MMETSLSLNDQKANIEPDGFKYDEDDLEMEEETP